jgi:hypothetical protein
MDTSAIEIEFDHDGVCGYCRGVRQHIGVSWFPDALGKKEATARFDSIRENGSNLEFDSILGLSGGLDSAVVASRAIDNGLRPLAVHVDGGWDSKASVQNIKSLTEELNIPLKTIVIDWQEMRQLQIAFLKSGTLNQDIPQDHCFFVSLYKVAINLNIKTILSGVNFATESVQPTSWGHTYIDGKNLSSIYKKFGSRELQAFPVWSLKTYEKEVTAGNFSVFEPLNFGPFEPKAETRNLEERFGWQEYGGKHEESIFTNWFQSIYLPHRYQIDKRKADFSSLIISGLLSRDEAISKLDTPILDPNEKNNLHRTVARKLQISVEELDEYMNLPHAPNTRFPSDVK